MDINSCTLAAHCEGRGRRKKGKAKVWQAPKLLELIKDRLEDNGRRVPSREKEAPQLLFTG
jgi:hypothetical protein